MNAFVALTVAIVIPVVGGFLSGYFITKDKVKKSNGWYDSLKKPAWNPPRWVFGPAWTLLYVLMGIASYLVWNQGGANQLALTIYGLQLLINFAWSPVFFGAQRPDIALILILVLWFMIIATMVLFYAITPVAMYLLVPYILWVTYASTLNGYIVYAN
jgi:tryptophan-rich sensory protein